MNLADKPGSFQTALKKVGEFNASRGVSKEKKL